MLEKERGLRRRRGAGQDASGAYRDIARDVFPPPEMLAGTRTTHENPWRYVLGCLLVRSSNSVDPSPSIKMLDTVLMEGTGGGHPEAFFFTAGNGTIKRKAGRFLGCARPCFRVLWLESPQLNIFLALVLCPRHACKPNAPPQVSVSDQYHERKGTWLRI